MARILLFGKNAKVTIRTEQPYKEVRRNVYFQNGVGTYIIYKNKKVGVQYTQFNNTATTLYSVYNRQKGK